MTCPTCSAANPDDARFCHNCGSPLAAPRAVEGERKLVTVLFADVVDSTAIAERLDPEQYAEVMNGAFDFMSAAVDRYGGTVARLMGDAVLAFFGAPMAHEDDAERAVRAGLVIRDAARDYARAIEPRYGVELHVRVGIHTGLVVAGEVGTEARTEYTAMGDTTNVAARLQGLAEPDTILISASTHRLVRNLFDVSRRANLHLKGKSAPIDAYVIHEPRFAGGSARGIEGMLSPLVGREAELGLLRARLAALREGRGGFVAVVGEVGLGKSRLVAEARSSVSAEPYRWVEGRALSFGRSTAYAPWRRIIRALVGAREEEPPAATRDRLRAEAERRGVSREDVPVLETLLGIESPETLALMEGLEGDALVRRIGQAVRELCGAVAVESPTVLVFDDLHWADTASLDLTLEVAGITASSALLFVCALRPERGTAAWRFLDRVRDSLGDGYTGLTLEPLSVGESRRLLTNLLDVQGLPEQVREQVLQKAEGNPFFLEEVLRSLVDSGHIVRENGDWRATREISSVAVPDTLVGVLSTRIDQLPDETKRVAQTAAVLGRIFAQRVLSAVCAAAPPPERIEEVRPHLETLAYEELVREHARHPEWEYIFKHALTQQAAYDLLLVKRRKALHRRAAGALEALHPEQDDEIAALLAHHYFRAEAWEPAGEYSRRAGHQALKLYALHEACDHFARAVEAAEHLEAADPRRLVDTILEWTLAGYLLRLHEQAAEREPILERLRHAERIARELDDRPRLGRVLIWQGNLYMLAGYPTESFPLLYEGYQIAVSIGDEALALAPLFTMTWFMVDTDPRPAQPRLRRVIEDARRFSRQPGAKELEAHALAILGLAHARVGEFPEAEEAIREALELAPHTRSPIKEADVEITVAMVYYEMGEFEKGLQYSRTGTELARSINGMECVCTGTFLTGYGNLQMRRIEEAQRAFEASFEIVLPLGSGMQSSKLRIQASLAFTRFTAGERQALAELEETLEKALASNDDFSIAYISQLLGDAYAETGALERAHERYQAALTYFRRKEMTPSVARVLNALAGLYDRQGLREEGDRVHAEAKALLHEMNARRSAVPSVEV